MKRKIIFLVGISIWDHGTLEILILMSGYEAFLKFD